MFLQRHAPRLKQHFKSHSDYIWISDNVLDDAIQRFTHIRIPRRNVGLAPGPMEAKKRASKRRMMNLAQSCEGLQLEPGLLPKVGIQLENAWQWQSPSQSTSRRSNEPVSLPHWLIDSHALRIADRPSEQGQEADQGKVHKTALVASRENLQDNPRFLEDLSRCIDLTSLRAWAANHHIELRRHSRLAFRQLCKGDHSLDILFEALRENALNNCDNLDLLFRQQVEQPLTSDKVRIIASWLKQSLFLGQWTESQVALIIDFVLHLSQVITDERLKHTVIMGVLEGLESSRVFTVKDLKYSRLGVLLKAVRQGTFTRLSHDLGFHIIKALGASQSTRLVHSISLFLQNCLEAQAKGLLGQSDNLMPESWAMLRNLPRRTSSAIIVDTSRVLIGQVACLPESHISLLRILDRWWSWIKHSDIFDTTAQSSQSRQIERLLTGKSMVVLATYLNHFDDSEIAHFMFRREFLTHLDLGDRSRALDHFRLISQTETDSSPYVAMIRATHHIGTVSDRSMLRMFRLLLMLQKSKHVANIILELRRVNIRVSEAAVLRTIKSGLHWKRHGLDQIYAVYRELPLEKCPELAERMIRGVGYQPGEAFKRFTRRHPGVIPGCCEHPQTIKARAQLLQRMALAYSAASHLTPHRALFYVYRCYVCHCRERLGSLGKGMLLALTRAGIVRPLESGQWVSTSRARWLLRLIRKFEGGQVANTVDKAFYEWRGLVIRKIRAQQHRRTRARYGARDAPMGFRMRRGWVRGEGYARRILEPLRR